MRKWQDLAPPDDPGSWYDVGNMWPTKRGTYETADLSTGTSKSATGADNVLYAFCTQTLSSTREYVIAGKIWEYTGGVLADRTNGMSIGGVGDIMMAQYGNATICVMGTAVATIFSTGTTFSALTGAPKGKIIVVCKNAVMILNTDSGADYFSVSDVGDYTNWTTGEAESRQIIETPGPITAAIAWGGDVYIFKKDAIYKATYTGGDVKWLVRLVWRGHGIPGDYSVGSQYQVVATKRGLVFNGSSIGNQIYLFDGSSPPQLLNPLTTVDSGKADFCYHPIEDVLVLAPAFGSDSTGTNRLTGSSRYYYYSFDFNAWGQANGSEEEDWETGAVPPGAPNGVLQGDFYARAEPSIKPVYWRYRNITGNALYRCAPAIPSLSSVSYLQTAMVGGDQGKRKFSRLIPRLRRRSSFAGGDSAAAVVTTYRERHDTFVSGTTNVTESTQKKRFDFLVSDNFARFKVTWTALDVEVDDFAVESVAAGTE